MIQTSLANPYGLCGIYRIGCTANNSYYFGQTLDIGARWATHRCELARGKHGNGRIQNTYRKYGADSFTFDIVLTCSPEFLDTAEQWLLDRHYGKPPCMNLCPNATSPRGRRHTAEAKQKMSVARKGRKLSAEHSAKISAANRGRKFTDAHKARLRSAAGARAKPVVGTAPDGTATSYPSVKEAARAVGKHKQCITDAIRRDGTAAGLRWAYAAGTVK